MTHAQALMPVQRVSGKKRDGEERTDLEQLMQESALHGFVTAAAAEALFQHCLTLALEAATDPGA